MKTKSFKTILALTTAGMFSFFQAHSQTALSGTAAASNNCGAVATGAANTSVGCSAGSNLTSGGNYNVALGQESLLTNQTGDNNTVTGYQSAYYNTGTDNTMYGYMSGTNTSTGNQNCFVGSNAGGTNQTGSNNTCIGYGSNTGASGLSNAAAIGANTSVNVSNNLVLGNNSTNVGVRLSGDATGALSPLSVGGNGNSAYEVFGYNGSGVSGAQGIRGEVVAPSGANTGYATVGSVVSGSGYAFGVYGSSYNATVGSGGRSYGVYGQAGNASNGYNYGVYGYIRGSNKGAGVFGTTSGDANVGATGTVGTFAGYFYGDLLTTDDTPEKPTAGSWTGYSDKRLKKDVAPFKDGISVLRKINPVTYQFNGIGGMPVNKTYIGVIAQDVQKVVPYCVGNAQLKIKASDAGKFGGEVVETIPSDSTEGTSVVNALTYNYDGLIYVLINSVKDLDSTATAAQKQAAEQQAQAAATKQADEGRIAALEADNAQMKDDMAAMKENMADMKKQLDNLDKALAQCCMSYHQNSDNGTSSNTDVPSLQQNNPNPFGENTTIRYYIPQSVKNAVIRISTINGVELKSYELSQRGNGELQIGGGALNAGTYSYTLIVDGNKVDSKMMILSK